MDTTPMGMLDMDITADTTADGAVAASTPRSGAPTRRIMDVFRNTVTIAASERGCLN